jgi:hypothetical protein
MSEYAIRVVSQPGAELETIVEARVRELVNEARQFDLPIHLKYSGGLDSLLVLLMLHRCDADFVVYLTPDSIKENQDVFKRYVSNRDFKHVNCPSLFDGLIISGDGADALFIDMLATSVVSKHGETSLDWKWEEGFVKGMYGTEQENNEVLELLFPALDECPWEVETVRDFFAWTGLAIFYQHETYRWLPTMPNPAENFARFRPFFPTKDFVEWSLGQETKAKFPSFTDYKPAFRKLCEKLTGLDFSYMRKDFSLWKTVAGNRLHPGVKDDLSIATIEEIEQAAIYP